LPVPAGPRAHHVALLQRRQVAALAGRARLHGAAAGADALVAALGAAAGEADGGIDIGHFDRQAALQPFIEPGDDLVGDRGIVGRPGDGELVAARAQLDVGELLDAHEMTIVIAVEHRQQSVVVERHAAHVGRAGACGRIAHAAAS